MPSSGSIFVTGFPGFIANRLVERLSGEGAKFLLLVQPAFVAKARESVERIAAHRGFSQSNFQIIEGDITRPDCGLSAPDAELVRREAGIVFHLAALYDLEAQREAAMRVNVEGTRNVNRFVASFARLSHYQYVSTCYVAGRRRGVIREAELRHTAGFRNYYEETKYLAELEVEELKGRLPVTIHRPAVVCGDSRTGETAKYDGVYYLINYLLKQPRLLSLFNIGNPLVRLNLVPVDFVVEAMAALSRDARAVGKTLQLADPAPPTTEELFDHLARCLAGRPSRLRVPPVLVRTSLQLPISPPVTGLPSSGVPYFFLDQTYDTTEAQRLLEPHGVRCPPFASYACTLIRFAAAHPKL